MGSRGTRLPRDLSHNNAITRTAIIYFVASFFGAVKRFNNEYISFTMSLCSSVCIQLEKSTTGFDEI
jgi:hypothetical protein